MVFPLLGNLFILGGIIMMKCIKKSFIAVFIACMAIHMSWANPFDPNPVIFTNGEDVLAYEKGAELLKNVQFIDITHHWAQRPITRMSAQSVIKGYGDHQFFPQNKITRQEALALLIRMMGKEGEVQKKVGGQFAGSIGNKILDRWAEMYIQQAQEEGILTGGEDVNFKRWATREEIGVWTAKALKLKPVFGIDQQTLFNFKDWKNISVENQGFIEAIAGKKIMQGNDQGYFYPQNAMTRSEMAALLNNISEQFYEMRHIKTQHGQVVAIQDNESLESGHKIREKRIVVNNRDGTLTNIYLTYDTTKGTGNDLIVFKNNVVSDSTLLVNGDEMEYLLYNGQVIYGEVVGKELGSNPSSQQVSGTINEVDILNGKISIVYDEHKTLTYKVIPQALVTLNLKVAQLQDLQYGQGVTLNIKNGWVTSIEGETFMDDPGYIPENGKVRIGKVKYLKKDTLTVEYEDKTNDTFTVAQDTRILKGGQNISFLNLKEGDQVKLYFSNIYTTEIDKIQVEGEQQLIKNVYKGKIANVHPSGRTITLTDLDILENSKWKKGEKSSITLNWDMRGEIYSDGQRINLNTLKKDYGNAELLVAVEDDYGKYKGIRAVVKCGNAKEYSDRIRDINWAAQRFELDNRKNIAYNEGTIVIKNSRLVSTDNIDKDLSAYVVVDHYGSTPTSLLVDIGADSQNIFDHIYVGQLKVIRTGNFDIRYYSEHKNNEWKRVSSRSSKTITLDYDQDTYIMDRTHGREVIDPYDFFHGNYSREDGEDYFAFIVADQEKRTIALSLRQDELLKENRVSDDDDIEDIIKTTVLTQGTIEEVDLAREKITLKNTYEWSPYYEEWRANRSNQYIDLEEALLLKNNESIDIDAIQKGDKVSIMRYNERGIIVLVE